MKLPTTRLLVIKPKRINSKLVHKHTDTALPTNETPRHIQTTERRTTMKASDRQTQNANKVMHHKYICHPLRLLDSLRSSPSTSIGNEYLSQKFYQPKIGVRFAIHRDTVYETHRKVTFELHVSPIILLNIAATAISFAFGNNWNHVRTTLRMHYNMLSDNRSEKTHWNIFWTVDSCNHRCCWC